MLLQIIAAVNMLYGSGEPLLLASSKKDGVEKGKNKAAIAEQCKGDLDMPGICEPVCDKIFFGVDDKTVARKRAEHLFKDIMSCDHVCTCVCDEICDEFMGE